MKANAYPEPALRRKSATGPRNLLEFGQSRGITAIIDNRSNGEDGDQPGSAVEKSAADDAGLGYSFVPLAGLKSPKPMCAPFRRQSPLRLGRSSPNCGSGTRSLTLHAIG